jgi:hypothetical protein
LCFATCGQFDHDVSRLCLSHDDGVKLNANKVALGESLPDSTEDDNREASTTLLGGAPRASIELRRKLARHNGLNSIPTSPAEKDCTLGFVRRVHEDADAEPVDALLLCRIQRDFHPIAVNQNSGTIY